MGRTLESAGILAAPHGLPVVPVPALREISHGRWETKTRREVEALWPEEYARWESDPYTCAPEGGETGLAVTARALPALSSLVAGQAGRSILVVSHKATIRLLLSALIGFDPRYYRDRLDQSPACLNVLDFKDPSHARLTLFNDVSHYARGAPGRPDGASVELVGWREDLGSAARSRLSGRSAGRPGPLEVESADRARRRRGSRPRETGRARAGSSRCPDPPPRARRRRPSPPPYGSPRSPSRGGETRSAFPRPASALRAKDRKAGHPGPVLSRE